MVLFPIASHCTASFPVMSSEIKLSVSALEVSIQTLPYQWVPSVPPSIPKGTCRSLILSNLTNFLFLHTPITDVLCFVFCIFVFIFCLPNIFQFSKGQVISILYPFMLLSKVLGLRKMHGKFSLNLSFHWQLLPSIHFQKLKSLPPKIRDMFSSLSRML